MLSGNLCHCSHFFHRICIWKGTRDVLCVHLFLQCGTESRLSRVANARFIYTWEQLGMLLTGTQRCSCRKSRADHKLFPTEALSRLRIHCTGPRTYCCFHTGLELKASHSVWIHPYQPVGRNYGSGVVQSNCVRPLPSVPRSRSMKLSKMNMPSSTRIIQVHSVLGWNGLG